MHGAVVSCVQYGSTIGGEYEMGGGGEFGMIRPRPRRVRTHEYTIAKESGNEK